MKIETLTSDSYLYKVAKNRQYSTLTSNSYLYKVAKNRQYFEDLKKQQRRAFWLTLGILACVAVVKWIVWR